MREADQGCRIPAELKERREEGKEGGREDDGERERGREGEREGWRGSVSSNEIECRAYTCKQVEMAINILHIYTTH